jgi:hypothetical protein
MPSLTRLRYERTLESNRVKRTIAHLLTSPVKWEHIGPDGLPTWWPFWSDSLVRNVCKLVRVCRELAVAENHADVEGGR